LITSAPHRPGSRAGRASAACSIGWRLMHPSSPPLGHCRRQPRVALLRHAPGNAGADVHPKFVTRPCARLNWQNATISGRSRSLRWLQRTGRSHRGSERRRLPSIWSRTLLSGTDLANRAKARGDPDRGEVDPDGAVKVRVHRRMAVIEADSSSHQLAITRKGRSAALISSTNDTNHWYCWYE
jgi:hypothetical protein